MLDIIVIIFIGWPALIASLLAWLAGLITKKFKIIIIAGILVLPFAFLYLGGLLDSRLLGLLLSLGHFGSAIAVRYNKMWLAWLPIGPYTLFVVMLAYSVLTQSIR